MTADQSLEEGARDLPDHAALGRLALGPVLVIGCEAVDRASWFAGRRNRDVKGLRSANLLVKIGRSLALKLGDQQSMASAVKRALECGLVVSDALAEADEATKPWLDSARLLGRIITVLGKRELSAPDEYDDMYARVVRATVELLAAVREVLPLEVRAAWCGQVRILVSELAAIPALVRAEERRSPGLRPVARQDQKLIGDRLVVRGATSQTHSIKKNRLRKVTDTDSIDHAIPEKPVTSHRDVLKQLATTEQEVQAVLTALSEQFRGQVRQLAGASFGSFEEKRECVQRLKRLAATFRLEFVYDGLPVSLQVFPNQTYGGFRLLQKRTIVYARATFPDLNVTEISSRTEQ